MKDWKLIVTRETLLLERYYRVLGYRDLFKEMSGIKVKYILVYGIGGMVKLYMINKEIKDRRIAIVKDIKKIGLKKFDGFFREVIANLNLSAKEVKDKKDRKSFRRFIKYYKLGRAIVLYTTDLAEGVKKSNMKKNIGMIGKWHEDAEVVTCNSWDAIKPFFDCITNKYKIKCNDLMFYTPQELNVLLNSGKKVIKNELNNRKKIFLIYLKDGKILFYSGKQANNIINKELNKETIKSSDSFVSGNIAYRGKVKGKVKIINASSDMSKMQKGNIIVSVMTAPRIYPALTKARGIVTNEGGVICHAAIVSRELKVPCVVGTKNATEIFKDGDIVELDAINGTVRKLNK